MHIAVHGKKFENNLRPDIQHFFNLLASHNLDVLVSESFQSYLSDSKITFQAGVYKTPNDLEKTEFLFTLGGDGTILDAVTHIGALEIPIVGVNMGRLGFLATIGLDQVEYALNQVVDNKFTIDKRILLRLDNDQGAFSATPFALNDFTILKKDTSSMIVVHTYVDGDFLNSYWADGLIISTPTGSTGYSLSCGGPLVLPQSNNFIVTPVSPHNLNVRPMVLGDTSTLSFKIEARMDKVLISLDSRSVTIPSSTELTISKESFCACLVKFDGYHPFDTMRQKLLWGQDARN